jgi:hypothetical protein
MIVPNHLIVDYIFLMWFLCYICTNNTFGNMQWLCTNILTAALASCLAAELPEAMVDLGNTTFGSHFCFLFKEKTLQFDINKKTIFTLRKVRRRDRH